MADEAQFPGWRGGRHRRSIHQGQADRPHQQAERPVHRQHAARRRAVVEQRRRFAGGNGLAAEPCFRTGRKPRGGGAIGDREDSGWAFRSDRGAYQGGVDVESITDQFRRDVVGLKHGSNQTGSAVVEGTHPIVEMRRLPCACTNRRHPFLIRGA